jgi:preprotein translocase subunit SecD
MRRNYLIPLLTIVILSIAAISTTLGLGKKPLLGLDLQGGASVVLQAKGDYKSEAIDKAKEIIRSRVDGLGVAEPEITRQGDTIVISLPGVSDQQKALDLVGKTAELRFRPVLRPLNADENVGDYDLAALQALQPQAVQVPSATETTVLDPATATAPATTVAGDASATTVAGDAVVTTIAGALGKSAPQQATTTTAAATTTTATTVAGAATTATTVAGAATTAAAAGAVTTVDPAAPTTTTPPIPTTLIKTTKPEDDKADQIVVLPQIDPVTKKVVARFELGPSFLTGAAVSDSSARFSDTGGWSVALSVKGGAEGIDAWNAAGKKCFDGDASCPGTPGRIAIVLDGQVQSAPQIQPEGKSGGQGYSPFKADQISISGNFKEKDARALALVLRYGALPVQLEPQAVSTLSATLGKDSLRAGVVAGLVGIGLVLLFMLFYYRLLAVIVFFGLCVSFSILWTIIGWQGSVMTLAGATGIIVSIGVTVDSYVVFFERLKDEVRSGKTLRSSTTKGFASAWRTIVAADTVSLIAAGILYWRTVGSVRGFAYYLGLSTLIDLVVAYFFTRNAVRLMASSKFFANRRVLGVMSGEAVAGGAA